MAAKDKIGCAELEASGKLWGMPKGTKLLMLDQEGDSLKCRVLSGKKYGSIYYVYPNIFQVTKANDSRKP